MSLFSAVLLGLLTAASIVQSLLLARAMIAGRNVFRRLTALEEDLRLMMAHLPRSGVTTDFIDAAEAASPRLPVLDPAADDPRGPRPSPGVRPASPARVRFVGGLNR